MKNKPESYQSILAPYITGLLEEKRANGFSYTAKETTLWQFDEYCVSQHVETVVLIQRKDTKKSLNLRTL